jgi:hypothetical protein
MSATIQSVKLTKVKKGQGLSLTLERDEAGGPMTASENHKGLIHADLKKAFDRLRIHLAVLCGYHKPSAVEDIIKPEEALMENFHVHAYSIGGDDNNQGIVISGHHIVPGSGLAVTLNTPFSRFDIDPKSRYVYMDDIRAAVTVIEQEVQLYLDGKRGKEPGTENQGELGLQDDRVAGSNVLGKERANPEAMGRVARNGQGSDKNKRGGRKTGAAASGHAEEVAE